MRRGRSCGRSIVRVEDLPRNCCAPSPLAGEGGGEGWPRARSSLGTLPSQSRSLAVERSTESARRVAPLSLTLPRKGGGDGDTCTPRREIKSPAHAAPPI